MPSSSKVSGNHNWVSLVPYGLHEQHPNAFKDIAETIWENRDQMGYAWRILNDGCCDGCSLGTTGMHDWTMKGIHLCAAAAAPAFEYDAGDGLAPARRLRRCVSKTKTAFAHLGRLSAPMIRRKGEKGFHQISWDEALDVAAGGLRETDPNRIGVVRNVTRADQ